MGYLLGAESCIPLNIPLRRSDAPFMASENCCRKKVGRPPFCSDAAPARVAVDIRACAVLNVLTVPAVARGRDCDSKTTPASV